jgi:hypothetical protein
MNAQGGFIKHLVWIVPVTIFVLWYISQRQEAQTDDMKADFAKFDENFAVMNAGLSTGDEKKHWKAAQIEAHERYGAAKEKAIESNKKADDTFNQMEKEMDAVAASNMEEKQ